MSSASLRNKGNVLYKQAADGGFGPSAKRSKLARAKQLYTQALRASGTEDDRASCCKNLGMLHWLWGKSELQFALMSPNDHVGGQEAAITLSDISVCKNFLRESVRWLSQAKGHGRLAAKPKAWLHHIDGVLKGMVRWAADQDRRLPPSVGTRAPLRRCLCDALEEESSALGSEHSSVTRLTVALALRSYAKALFKEGLQRISQDAAAFNDYTGCLGLLLDCQAPLARAHSILAVSASSNRAVIMENKDVLLRKIEELQQSAQLHGCICEAMQAVFVGDVTLQKALTEEEGMDMDGVMDALDHYKRPSLLTRELDMETEGIAMSRIGKVYSDVLKWEEKAHKHHFQATRLALTVMSPRLAKASWYIYSLEKVRAHQEKILVREREIRDAQRQPYLTILQPKLEQLAQEATRSAESFLKYLCDAHPHPDLSRNVLPILSSKESVKASLKKAILCYHPDTNCCYDEEWKVLSEEICKHLNRKYESFK